LAGRRSFYFSERRTPEITIAAYSVRLQELDWEKCHVFYPCRGALITAVTDMQGFVIHPFRFRGRYIY